jgi:hypothetical protein
MENRFLDRIDAGRDEFQPKGDAGRRGEPFDHRLGGGVRTLADDFETVDVLQPDLFAVGERMVGPHRENGFVAGQFEAGGAFRHMVERAADQGEIGIVLFQAADRLGRARAVEPDVGLRIAFAVARQRLRQQIDCDRGGRGDAQWTDFIALQALDDLLGIVDRARDLLCRR